MPRREGIATFTRTGVAGGLISIRAGGPCREYGRGRTNMANTPKKLQDPTEVALSAIQDALNLRDVPPGPTAGRLEPLDEPEPPRDGRRRRASAIDEDLFFDSVPTPTSDPDVHEPPQPPRRAANDDRRTAGQIMQALQRRPSIGPYVGAALFAVVWAGLGFGWLVV